jgi:thiamine-monophosphate kinase
VDDDIWISGALGDARLALAAYRSELSLDGDALLVAAERLHAPMPRVELGLALRGIAHAAIDLSDGLAGDLVHILERSGVGATLDLDALPCGAQLSLQEQVLRRRFMLAGGDDYELCFTAPQKRRDAVLEAARAAGTAVSRVGSIDAQRGLHLVDSTGAALDLRADSFDHFLTS